MRELEWRFSPAPSCGHSLAAHGARPKTRQCSETGDTVTPVFLSLPSTACCCTLCSSACGIARSRVKRDVHSQLPTTTGATSTARRAGIQQAINAAAPRTTATPTTSRQLICCTTCDGRVSQQFRCRYGAERGNEQSQRTTRAPSAMMRRKMARFCAPTARRTPISCRILPKRASTGLRRRCLN